MRIIDADKMIADLLTVDPQFEPMIKWCITVIEAQPTVNEWIPTSERLPDKEGLYRVTIHPDYLTPQMVQTDDFYWENGRWKFWEVEHLKLVLYEVDVEVIAWKPLEEPYKE